MSSFMTFGDVGPVVGVTLVAQLLREIEPVLVCAKWAKSYPMPTNKGEAIKWRRVRPLAVSTTSLTEGVTPSPTQIAYDTVTTVISQFGGWVQITDKIEDLAENQVLQDATRQLTRQAAATKEMILWGVLRGGTAVIYSNGANRAAVNTPLDSDLFMAASNTLKRNHALMKTSILKAGPNIATEPVGASYVAIGHVDLERDLRGLADFVPTERYASGTYIDPNEIGKVTNTRIILSPDLPGFPDAGGTATGMRSTTGTNADVYPLVIFGEDFYGDVALKGLSSVMMQVNKPKMTPDDPLGQRGSVAWKMYYQALRLNESYGIRIECAATALS